MLIDQLEAIMISQWSSFVFGDHAVYARAFNLAFQKMLLLLFFLHMSNQKYQVMWAVLTSCQNVLLKLMVSRPFQICSALQPRRDPTTS